MESPQPSSSQTEVGNSRNDLEKRNHSTPAPSTGDFRFDQILQSKWNQAMEEGIKLRNLGVTFKMLTVNGLQDLQVVGLGASVKYQETIFSLFSPFNIADKIRNKIHPPVKDILTGFEGSVKPGEMLLVLGRPGSGCSTFLKVLANERKGFEHVYGEISYDGISPTTMERHYRGDIAYVPEDDIHFPSLTEVSTAARAPRLRIGGQTRKQYINNMVDILGKLFGLTHAFNTPIGDENIHGISGGEKKRVSIAETLSMRVRLASWDNSTRGLDASTALEFVQALRTATDIAGATSIVSIYQASENIYCLFDKVLVIDAGRMSYFGPAKQARQYFIEMGYEPAHRQTTADFLVSITDPTYRIIRRGYEARVPRLPSEFASYFLNSELGKRNNEDTKKRFEEFSRMNHEEYAASARAEHSRGAPKRSPYNVGMGRQLRLLMKRRLQIIRGNIAPQTLIMGSVFFNMPLATRAYFSRGGVLFFAILFSALTSMAEIPALYAQRPIVARHHRAALYYPFIDALALTVVDMVPFASMFSLYFMTHLQRQAGKFFIYAFFVYLGSLTMKAFYRTLAASFKRASGAQALAGIGTLTYINPVTYAFEGLVANEFRGLKGACSSLVPSGPGYESVDIANQVCTTLGSQPGSATVDGGQFIGVNFGYRGILFVFWGGYLFLFFFMTERGSAISVGSATQLVFKRGSKGKLDIQKNQTSDPETGPSSRNDIEGGSESSSPTIAEASDALPPSKGVFSWHHLNYDVQLSFGKHRRLLNDVSGYVVPGKLTALMGESGAGKTTLLNALAERLPTGIITGDRFVDGQPLSPNFGGQTGYCQQMDIHLETTTVREALQFSALLRQPASVSKKEKYDYVQDVIRMCDMESYADAIVGTVGEGLNVEQRKRLTVGVELAAKPELLLFLDEPTSGLSSQNAWSIMKLLRSLADKGQAILCTIHQPSAELFEMFDRLLLLRTGGETCYFGDLGQNTTELIQYFEGNGARKCQHWENPAEYMLDVIGAGATAKTDIDWYATWKNSRQFEQMENELQDILKRGEQSTVERPRVMKKKRTSFPAPVKVQLSELMKRGYRNYFRSPPYLLSKYGMNIFAGLFIGFTFFKTKHNQRGIQNSVFANYMAVVLGAPLSNMLQLPFIRFRTSVDPFSNLASKASLRNAGTAVKNVSLDTFHNLVPYTELMEVVNRTAVQHRWLNDILPMLWDGLVLLIEPVIRCNTTIASADPFLALAVPFVTTYLRTGDKWIW
ncbi:hypothetical protein Clacol_004963 [Clathrus columnatus]|uniref:ABC transporter domain-containing protein n=1 Tax=Clathrus columnatus TaxID=1419009 RepID=A0AAV5ACJ3_9AGAM|nr:hypothetical protein Clacol_004963 [Clathrus columnatus]